MVQTNVCAFILTQINQIIFGIHLYFLQKTSIKHILLLFLILNSLTSKNVAYIGLRSVDVEEKEMLEKLNIEVFSMREIDDLGIKEVWDSYSYGTIFRLEQLLYDISTNHIFQIYCNK